MADVENQRPNIERPPGRQEKHPNLLRPYPKGMSGNLRGRPKNPTAAELIRHISNEELPLGGEGGDKMSRLEYMYRWLWGVALDPEKRYPFKQRLEALGFLQANGMGLPFRAEPPGQSGDDEELRQQLAKVQESYGITAPANQEAVGDDSTAHVDD